MRHLSYFVDNVPLGLKEASLYDSVKIAALSVMQSGSIRGVDLQTAIREVAANYIGASGRMVLDGNGDRVGSDFEIYGFDGVDVAVGWIYLGRFDSETGDSRIFFSQK